VSLGVFAGQLQFAVYKGSNLIQQEVVAKTDQKSVAYKYDAGLKGLSTADSKVTWRDLANLRQEYLFGGAKNERETPLKTANRLIVAERGRAGSIAAFPPPHNFFWARESDQNPASAHQEQHGLPGRLPGQVVLQGFEFRELRLSVG